MKIQKNISLKKYNSLKIEAKARYFVKIYTISDLQTVLKSEIAKNHKVFILGEGANILFTKDFDGLIIKMHISGITIVKENENTILTEVGAGEIWHDLVSFTAHRSWGGIENMALIPGTVGGGVVGNIAAYGQNVSDVIESVTAINIKTQKITTYSHDECAFSYRESIFKHALKNKVVILNARFRFSKNAKINTEYWSNKHGSVGAELERNGKPPYGIIDVFNAIISLRSSKFPDMKKFGTAGSFFKNPKVTQKEFASLQKLIPSIQYYPAEDLHYVKNNKNTTYDYYKVPAGGILDKGMHMAGLWHGNVGLYEAHAALLVTRGHVTGAEVVAFAQFVQTEFYNYCGIRLETEVLFV